MDYLFNKKNGKYYFAGRETFKDSFNELRIIADSLKNPYKFELCKDGKKIEKSEKLLEFLINDYFNENKLDEKIMKYLGKVNLTINHIQTFHDTSENFNNLAEKINYLNSAYDFAKAMNKRADIERMEQIFGCQKNNDNAEKIIAFDGFFDYELRKKGNDYDFLIQINNCEDSDIKINYSRILKTLSISAFGKKKFRLKELSFKHKLKKYEIKNCIISCFFKAN